MDRGNGTRQAEASAERGMNLLSAVTSGLTPPGSGQEEVPAVSPEQARVLGLVQCDWHGCKRKYFAPKNGNQKYCGKPFNCKKAHDQYRKNRESARKTAVKEKTAEQKAIEKKAKRRITLAGLAEGQESILADLQKLSNRFANMERVVQHNAERFTKQESTLDDCQEMLQAIFTAYDLE